MPVTTDPNPFIENARSIGKRIVKSCERGGTRCPISMRRDFNSSKPAPVRELTVTSGAPSRNDPVTNSCASSATSSSISSSTRSFFVITTRPLRTPSRRQMSKCSRVCGITPSSAAITSASRSMPCAPANMFLTNRSWPGTSTKPRRRSPSSRSAKPRSIVMPRRFSSGSRSGSMPVKARTSALFP